ncbi:MAG TPA: Bax inhibitor-1/YccA family protein [Ilumatobacteraceae bacterium]|nr:Bax inhibitor-1/YccA family protein [Ilumatobacteraceae bacterium]
MSNPILNDKAMREASQAGYAAGAWGPPQGAAGYAARETPITRAPMTDGPISAWQSSSTVMTVQGATTATGVLFVVLLAAAALGWSMVKVSNGEIVSFPAWTIGAILVGLGLVILMRFKPQWAKYIGFGYAVAQGLVVGAISHAYEVYQDGIVIQAIGATVGVFAVMLFLYRTNVIKVTDRMRRIVMGATLGVAVFYGISLLINLFGGNVGFLTSTSLVSVGFSFLVAGLAAFNLALDFDFIEKGSKQGLPKQMEWVAAVGLLVTVVWLYLEILRLLSKLRDR